MENLLTIDASAASHVGMVRAVNTDNFFLNGRYIHEYEMDSIQASVENRGNDYLFAVSDSMDEVSEDKKASISVAKELKKLQDRYKSSSKDLESRLELLRESAEELSNLIHSMTLGTNEEAVRKPAMAGLVLSRNRAGIVCMGNCRVYLYRGGMFKQLISDSKKAERLLKMGIITSDQVEMLRGSGEGGKKDYKKCEIMDIRAGDIFLLCSNGVTDLVEEDALAEIISMNESASELTGRIIRHAIKNGGDDCVTAVVVKVDKIEGEQELDQVPVTKTRGRTNVTAPAGKAPVTSGTKPGIKKYVSAAVSIIIIGMLIFAVYKVVEKNRSEAPDGVSLETTQQGTQESTYEDTVAGTNQETIGESTQAEATGETGAGMDNNQQTGTQKYIVKTGDSLLKISKQFYNDESKYTLIMKANNIKDPNKIQIDQELIIPDITEP